MPRILNKKQNLSPAFWTELAKMEKLSQEKPTSEELAQPACLKVVCRAEDIWPRKVKTKNNLLE